MIILNSGLVHRVGVNRLHVGLARKFAANGFTTLRFDLSGIGDSRRSQESKPLAESVTDDIHHAFDFLRASQQKKTFVLMGLCSGAHDAFCMALHAPEVVGLALLDLPGLYRNWQHVVFHYRRRLFRWESWRNAISGSGSALRRLWRQIRSHPWDEFDEEEPEVRSVLPRAEMEEDFHTLLSRGVFMNLVFTLGVEYAYNHASQFREVFPSVASSPLVANRFFSESDHVFGDFSQRCALKGHLADWLTSTFDHRDAHGTPAEADKTDSGG